MHIHAYKCTCKKNNYFRIDVVKGMCPHTKVCYTKNFYMSLLVLLLVHLVHIIHYANANNCFNCPCSDWNAWDFCQHQTQLEAIDTK